MNRSLVIPAAGCCLGFVALLAAFQVSLAREATTGKTPVDAAATLRKSIANEGKLLSRDDAKQVLTALSGEFMRPWKQWENSPQRLYSRVAPSPIASISAEVAVAEELEDASFQLGTIAITTGPKSQQTPCVVDRANRQVRLYSEGKWITSEQWLKAAPLPRGTKG